MRAAARRSGSHGDERSSRPEGGVGERPNKDSTLYIGASANLQREHRGTRALAQQEGKVCLTLEWVVEKYLNEPLGAHGRAWEDGSEPPLPSSKPREY
jgi:hypothetical protein